MLIINAIDDITDVKFNNIKKITIIVSEALKDEFQELVNVPGIKLLIDMHSIESIDSSGFAVLLAVSKSVQKSNGQIIFYNMSDYVFNLFKTLHLNTLFKIIKNYDEAIKSFEV